MDAVPRVEDPNARVSATVRTVLRFCGRDSERSRVNDAFLRGEFAERQDEGIVDKNSPDADVNVEHDRRGTRTSRRPGCNCHDDGECRSQLKAVKRIKWSGDARRLIRLADAVGILREKASP